MGLLAAFFATSIALSQEPLSGDVFVKAGEEAGAIFVDGISTGQTTPAMLEGLPPGPHTVRVTMGCRNAVGEVEVRAGAIARLDLVPVLGQGRVAVQTSPPGAQVLFDGAAVGTAPLDGTLPCGSHTVGLVLEGHQPIHETFTVGLSQAAVLERVLAPVVMGSLTLKVDPLTSLVEVDGTARGTGPMTLDGLSVGPHRVALTSDGHEPWSQEVDIAEGQNTRLEVTLPPLAPPEPLGERLGLTRVRWTSVFIATFVSGAAVGLGAASWQQRRTAVTNYEEVYLGLTYDQSPELYYDQHVRLPRTRSVVLGAGAGVAAVLAGVSWVLLPLQDGEGMALVVSGPLPSR